MSEWNKLVSKTYAQNKHKPGYKLKDAMMDAKKVYKKQPAGTTAKVNKRGKSRSRRGTKKHRKH